MTSKTSLSASTETLTGKTSTEATSTAAAPLTSAETLTTSPPKRAAATTTTGTKTTSTSPPLATAATSRAAATTTTATTTVRTSGLISRYWSDNRRMWNKTFRVFCRIRTDLDPRNFGGRLNFSEFDQIIKSPNALMFKKLMII